MKSLLVVAAVLIGAGGAVCYKVMTYDPVSQQQAPVDLADVQTWKPDLAEIRSQLEAIPSEMHRKKRYGELFKQRYRQKDMPVNLRVDSKGTFYLECAATIPTWDKSVIASQAWREIRLLFGEAPRLLIYESYIGAASRWVGEVRPQQNQPEHPEVLFDTGWHLRRDPLATDYLDALPRG